MKSEASEGEGEGGEGGRTLVEADTEGEWGAEILPLANDDACGICNAVYDDGEQVGNANMVLHMYAHGNSYAKAYA
jgi:hypothetical protein